MARSDAAMRRRVMAARVLAVAAGACGALTTACSSTPPAVALLHDASSPVSHVALPTCDGGGLTVAFNPMYSAYDGVHTFSVPALVVGSSDNVVWSADSTFVGITPDME